MVSMQRVDGACPYASTWAFSVSDFDQPLDLHIHININHPHPKKHEHKGDLALSRSIGDFQYKDRHLPPERQKVSPPATNPQ